MQPRKFNKEHYLTAISKTQNQSQEIPKFAALTWNGLQSCISYYHLKYGIKIYIAGETALGKNCIAAQRDEIANEYRQELDDLSDENYRYAYFASHYSDQFKELCGVNSHCANAYQRFCEQYHLNDLIDLPSRILLKLNDKLKLIANEVGGLDNLSLKHAVDAAYFHCEALKNLELDAIHLSFDQVWQEMRVIQTSLRAGEAVGYFDVRVSERLHPNKPFSHSEAFIITSESIIQTVNYSHLEGGYFVLEKGIYHTSANEFLRDIDFESPLRHPQGDKQSCNMFALMYLKELLRDNSHQLKENCLLFTLNGIAVLIPSPQVLRYSQSRRYNDLMVAIIMSDETTFQIKQGPDYFNVFSLKGLLEKSHHQKLLNDLPHFRTNWIAGYKLMLKQRERMNFKSGNYVKNHYVLFKAECIKRRVDEEKERLTFGK